MKAAIQAKAAQFNKSRFAILCRQLGGLLDCVIPIVLVVMILIGSGLIAFGYIK